jgi:chlorite dismutase
MGFSEIIQAADREKLLSDAGVYGTFAVFQVDVDWWKMDKAARASAVTAVREVFQKHGEKIAIDTYLSRGLSDRSDFFVR